MNNKIIQLDILQDDRFYRLPKVLFSSEKYAELFMDAKFLYMLLLDRRCLSEWTGDNWKDEYGCTYIYFTIKEMMRLMNLGNKKINGVLKELEQYELIYRRHMGLGKPNKIYVCDLFSSQYGNWMPKCFRLKGGACVNE